MKNIRKAIINSRRRCEWYIAHPIQISEETENEQTKKTR